MSWKAATIQYHPSHTQNKLNLLKLAWMQFWNMHHAFLLTKGSRALAEAGMNGTGSCMRTASKGKASCWAETPKHHSTWPLHPRLKLINTWTLNELNSRSGKAICHFSKVDTLAYYIQYHGWGISKNSTINSASATQVGREIKSQRWQIRKEKLQILGKYITMEGGEITF